MTTASFASKYKVIQKIGEGSFSEVLKCEDKQTGMQYAAKRLRKVFKSTTDVMRCAEIIAMHKLSRHPNVLYMIEYFHEAGSGRLVYVFELMDMSLYDFMKMRKRCLPESKITNYFYQMLRGLEHLHRNGLFHRDIKPENVLIKLLNQIELVKLADLGSIRGIYSRPPYTEYISTRWYRSPECLLSVGYYGPKMDVWAAGCVFYEMLTLKPLFPGSNEVDQLAKIHAVLGTPSPRLINRIKKKSHNCENFPRQIGSGLNPLLRNFSEEAQHVIKLMLQYDPENRINVRRLIEHKYFASLKEKHLLEVCSDLAGIKGRGDHHHVNSSSDKAERGRQRKFTSKTYTDMDGYEIMPKKCMLRDGSGPLLTHRQFRLWRGDPAVLKPREVLQSTFVKRRNNYNQKRSLQNPDTFSKTTSNLPAKKESLEVAFTGKRHFQSKSFVLPRRVVGCFKLNTINDRGVSVLSRLMSRQNF